MTIQVPLSLSGPPDAYAKAVQAHRNALEAHLMGKPGKPAPIAPNVVAMVIQRQPQEGPVATRGPDQFVILPYTIVDDLPKTEEQSQAISVLRETLR